MRWLRLLVLLSTSPRLHLLFAYPFITLLLRLTVVLASSDLREDVDDDDGPVVDTDLGPVRGYHYRVPHLRLSGDAYLGIPYAKPPVGDLRFMPPVTPKKWTKIFDAKTPPNSCHQPRDELFGADFPGSSMWNPNTEMSEDCLYVNVWVPSPSSSLGTRGGRNSKLAVLVWIFGGGFYSGTSTLELYDSKILASMNDVVVVSIGYRVGALGFLCLDHPTAPCNAGLYDQLMALDWIQRNVEKFGGDRDNVTLWGESAGSASVSLHLLSPLSRDKFHRAILQSGTANMNWATTTMKEGKLRSVELGINYLNCEVTEDMAKLGACLRKIDAVWLTEQQWVSRGILQFPFLPVVDGKFLPESPAQAIRHHRFKRCDILIGSNLNEGSYFLIYELGDHLSLEKKTMTRESFLNSINLLFFNYPQYRQELNSSFLLDAIAFQYTNWLDVNDTDSNVNGLDNAIGDCYFVCPLNEFALAYAEAGSGRLSSVPSGENQNQPRRSTGTTSTPTFDVYSYYFTERYISNPWPEWMGVMHGDEILFAFGHVLKEGGNFTEDEKRLSVDMMRKWTNFAKTGDPNDANTDPQRVWPPHTAARREYLELSTRLLNSAEERSVGRGPRAKFCAFWTNYVPKLLSATAEIVQKEEDWKLEFSEWSTRYIVDWKLQFDSFSASAAASAKIKKNDARETPLCPPT